ncbi:HNH endonuclease [Sciscionella marina]|uniref:HNH endonuclease n=1 Tax=Sciscionella marina TaxID=508770 RepID=UPI00035CAB80|nr:HNH endonuclease signature motif containing protein [Sciscionella marina]
MNGLGSREFEDALVESTCSYRTEQARLDHRILIDVHQLWRSQAARFGEELARDSVIEELRLAWCCYRGKAIGTVELSVEMHERFPELLSCMSEGLLDSFLASKATEVLRPLTPELAAIADRRIAQRLREQGLPHDWRAYLRRIADSLDPTAKQKRLAQARAARYVSFQDEEDGTGTVFARIPAEDSHACETRIRDLARAIRQRGDTRTQEQIRADVFTDLLLGRGDDHPPVHTVVNVHVPLGTALQLNNSTAIVDGMGEIPAHVARQLLADPNNVVRKVLTDPDTGVVQGLGRKRYRPTRRQRDFVHIRDRHCRAPGCRRPIVEIDHVEQWHRDHGTTDPANLQGLCRINHKLKRMPDWKHQLDPTTARLTITTPTGREYTSTPG